MLFKLRIIDKTGNEVEENMTTSVGMNANETIGMNSSQSIGMNSTQSVGAMKMTSVLGDASLFITGKLMEMIEGDVQTEVKQGKTITNSESGIETVTQGKIHNDAQRNIDHRSGEIGKSH